MLTVILGGARSGKSSLAEELGRRSGGPVTFVATAPRIEGDDDLLARIERHRADRPDGWTTIEEELDLAAAIDRAGDGFLIVDCLTVWVGNLQFRGHATAAILDASDRALDRVRRRTAETVVVSNEVGLGIVPADADTRQYRDVLGRVNREWAGAADHALFLVAGRALPLHRLDDVLGRP